MRTYDIVSPIVDADRAAVISLLEESRTALGFDPLSENKAIAITGGHRSGTGVLLRDGGVLRAYAHIEPDGDGFATEVVVAPSVDRSARDEMTAALLGRVIDEVAGHGGGVLSYFLFAPDEADLETARRCGLSPTRELLVLERPTDAADLTLAVDARIAPFRPGADEAAWVALNSRAFSWHPEQGSWAIADLEEREHQDWFEADGLLCAWVDGRLAGTCWTKVHDGPDAVGEIYVMSVDPDFQGTGLGNALLAAGMTHLARRAVPATILYVEGDNEAALALYRRFGFTPLRRTVVATAQVSAP